MTGVTPPPLPPFYHHLITQPSMFCISVSPPLPLPPSALLENPAINALHLCLSPPTAFIHHSSIPPLPPHCIHPPSPPFPPSLPPAFIHPVLHSFIHSFIHSSLSPCVHPPSLHQSIHSFFFNSTNIWAAPAIPGKNRGICKGNGGEHPLLRRTYTGGCGGSTAGE